MYLDKTCVALLVLGDLGEAGIISANTLAKTKIKKFCVVADDSGKNWLINSTEIRKFADICFHENIEILEVITQLEVNNLYANFQTTRFIRLMILKWLLLLDIFKNHSDINFSLYSDLDIIWRGSPIEEIKKISNSDKIFHIQEDSKFDGSNSFLCPGIMLWKKNAESIAVLNAIYKFQFERNLGNNLLADDKALNLWLKDQKKMNIYEKLPRNLYVIGHSFPWLMIGAKKFKLNKIICFHGNYIIGKEKKLRVLKAAMVNSKNPARYYFGMIGILEKLFTKIASAFS